MKATFSILVIILLLAAGSPLRGTVIFQGGKQSGDQSAKAGEQMERSLEAFHAMLVGIEMKDGEQAAKAKVDARKFAEEALVIYRAVEAEAESTKINLDLIGEDKKRLEELRAQLPKGKLPSTEKELAALAVAEVDRYVRLLSDFAPTGSNEDFDKAFALSKVKWRLEELGFLCSRVWQTTEVKR